MEDQLRLFLLLGGTVFIIAVLAHGIWKIRKNSKPSEKERLEPRQWQDDDNDFESDEQEGFDELGIGAVRVVSKSQNQEHEAASNVSTNTANGPAHHDINEKHAYSSEEADDEDSLSQLPRQKSTVMEKRAHTVSMRVNTQAALVIPLCRLTGKEKLRKHQSSMALWLRIRSHT